MKIVGIITEYNPFHNGHQYQAMQAKALSGADCAVAVMSGNFVQRGEPAICDKWSRAHMAVSCGVDLVIELPAVYAMQSAEYFAMGGVRLLDAMGADFISFGVEDDCLDALTRAADLLCTEPQGFKDMLAEGLAEGLSFPEARARAAAHYGAVSVLATPNNILAVEYLKAMRRIGAKMQPVPVKRRGSQHDGFGSASYVRGIDHSAAKAFMPEAAYDIYAEEIRSGRAPVNIKAIEPAILSRLRLMDAETLSHISGVSEGLENRIKQAANDNTGIGGVIDSIKTKRYTHSRIRRIMLNVLLGITRTDITAPPQYLRVLAMSGGGRAALKQITAKSDLPVIVKTAGAGATDMLRKDFAATDIYALMYPNEKERVGNLDYYRSPIVK